MPEQSWKYVKPLQDKDAVEKFEAEHGVQFPVDLKAVIKKYNGGRPPLKCYDIATEKRKEFKTLLSFNRSDIETIYKIYPLNSTDKELIPFASDPAGNYFVVKNGCICLWNHEKDTVEVLTKSFTEFLKKLHE